MKDEGKTKEQLINELAELRQRVAELEAAETERKRVEEVLRKRTHDLGERVKELNCLYGISNLVNKPGISLEEILRGVVALIPPAWQYPEITCARLILAYISHLPNRIESKVYPAMGRFTPHPMHAG